MTDENVQENVINIISTQNEKGEKAYILDAMLALDFPNLDKQIGWVLVIIDPVLYDVLQEQMPELHMQETVGGWLVPTLQPLSYKKELLEKFGYSAVQMPVFEEQKDAEDAIIYLKNNAFVAQMPIEKKEHNPFKADN